MATMAAWPADLPVWHTDGYGIQPQDPNVRTQMDSGARRVRRRFIRVPTDITASTVLTEAEFAVFEAWWENQAFAGSAWVLLPLTNGRGTNVVQSRFTKMYQAAPLAAGQWQVDVAIETLSLPVANG